MISTFDLIEDSLRIYRERKAPFHFLTGMMALFAIFYIKDWGLSVPVMLFLAAAAGAGFIWLSLKDSFFSLMLLVCYLPFNGRFSAGLSRTLPLLSPALMLLMFILTLIFLRKFRQPEKWQWPPGTGVLCIFILWGLISIFGNMYFGSKYLFTATFHFWESWLFPIVLYFLFYNLVKTRDEKIIIVMLIIGAVFLVALLAAFSYFDGEKRVGGIFNHPNRLAAFFNYYMFLPLGILLCNYRRSKNWILSIPFLACIRGLMVTFSRGGYAAFAFAVFIIAFYRNKIIFMILLLGAVFLYSHPQYLPMGVRWRLGQTVKETYVQKTGQHYTSIDPSVGNRFVIWRSAVDIIADNPVFGVGYERFRYKIQNYWKEGIPFDAHNTFLCTAAESGIPAAVCLLIILGMFFLRASWVYLKIEDPFIKGTALGFLGSIGGYLVSNLYVSRLDFTEIIAYFWIIAALILRPYKESELCPKKN